jgi:cytidylate kinase
VLGFLSPLASDALGTATDTDPALATSLSDEAAAFREQAEQIMTEAFETGAVVLGRAGAAAFRKRPDILRVRLYGPEKARLARAADYEQIDLATARQRMREVDSARDQYVRRLYRVSVDDPALFQLQIDTTAVPLATCADLIVMAYQALVSTR